MSALGMQFTRALINIAIPLSTRLQVYGDENMPRSGSFVIVSNHLGRLDPPLVYYFLDRPDIIMLVAEKYRHTPLIPWFVKQLNGMFVDRFGGDVATVREALNRLKAGGVLVLAPEGTRSKALSLLEGRPGASYLAAKAGAPIIPVGITGTEDKKVVANLLRLRKSPVILRVGEPFYLPPLHGHDREAQLEQDTIEIMCRLAALLPPDFRGVYTAHPRLKELLAQ
jgi:1-acyl-sn-glycerol-3-phosphate acyltransferase